MRTFVTIASLTILIGTAAPAHADPAGETSGSDKSFLASLKSEGVTYKDGSVAVTVGKKSCELMDQGHPKSQIVQSLAADNPGFSPESANKFTTSAVNAYCPQHAGDSNAAPPAAAPSPAPAQQPVISFPVITPPSP